MKCDETLRDAPVTETPKEDIQRTLNRLKRIEGQVRGVQKMVEDDRYCIDILIQLSAIQSALKNVGFQVTEKHIQHCVTHAIQNGEGDESIQELMTVLKQFNK
ncbi:metal-sensing transcriptional repressor [Abyssicoccus albus]|uniref:DNA-binding FrmR family transcriptional regulator n=1 Tax=Abyssicoccus albus TaxID=1817405 RepID=A0A3N5CIQ3_9BACL|nr:metal-sensing transcriptional repressor [Abyssicoccus albus]RPF57541.1 DNA-binding FrmR family transcriptional regulator [Abyssicoccus albus]